MHSSKRTTTTRQQQYREQFLLARVLALTFVRYCQTIAHVKLFSPFQEVQSSVPFYPNLTRTTNLQTTATSLTLFITAPILGLTHWLEALAAATQTSNGDFYYRRVFQITCGEPTHHIFFRRSV